MPFKVWNKKTGEVLTCVGVREGTYEKQSAIGIPFNADGPLFLVWRKSKWEWLPAEIFTLEDS